MSETMRILEIPRRPDPRLVAEFAKTATAHLSDSMERLQAAGAELRPMHAGGVLAGPAFTVKTAPGDNLLVHKALDMAQPGDVIVVDAGGFRDHAVLGEIMARWAARRGIAGVVAWGAIRDSAEIRTASFPVYACAVTHRGPYKNGPGEINIPVAIAGMPVHPGDIIVGDADGIVAVPLEIAERVLASAKAIRQKEAVVMQQIDAGTLDRAWVDETLRRKGYGLP
jgi:RraA family protein